MLFHWLGGNPHRETASVAASLHCMIKAMDPNLKDTYSKYQLWINYDPGGVFALKEPQCDVELSPKSGSCDQSKTIRHNNMLLEIDYK